MGKKRLVTRNAPTKGGSSQIVYIGDYPTNRKWQKAFADQIGNGTGKCMENKLEGKDIENEDGRDIDKVWKIADSCTPEKDEVSLNLEQYD